MQDNYTQGWFQVGANRTSAQSGRFGGGAQLIF